MNEFIRCSRTATIVILTYRSFACMF